MKNLLLLTLCICLISVHGYNAGADCPGDICKAVYQDALAVIRADDGDVIIPTDDVSCEDMKAVCMGDSCHSCKCTVAKHTFSNDKKKCESYTNPQIVYSRGGLAINTSVSTVYFAKNSESMLELRSVATGAQLPLVANASNTIVTDCTFYKMKVNTLHTGWEEVSFDGYSLTFVNDKGFIQINPGSIKIQPEHLQGQLVYVEFKCPKEKRKLYFKIQGKAVNLEDDCPNDCDGNFKYLEHLAVPEFPKPNSNSDSPINMATNALQRNGQDVSNCNEDSSEVPTISYYANDDTCSSSAVPGSELIYASGTNIMGRNLEPSNENAQHWDTITDAIIKANVYCSSNNKHFCVLFRLTNSSSICTDNPCKNGGSWVQNGLSSCNCQCPNGFTGIDCSIGQTCIDNPCCDGATCTDNGNSYTCSCPAGKTGSTCCDNIDHCANDPCADGATCISETVGYDCTCPPGKTGDICDQDIDYCVNNTCAGDATCVSFANTQSFECTCPPGKTGDNCDQDIDYCVDNTCAGNATCTSFVDTQTFKCTCPAGKTGDNCDQDIDYCVDNTCAGDATCTSFVDTQKFECTCPPGKTGNNCDQDIDYCVDNTCAGDATCTSFANTQSFKCTCPAGKTGDNCDQDIDYCVGNTCADGSTCVSNSRSLAFTCTCPPGKTGTTCDQDIDYCIDNACADGATCVSNPRSQTYECNCPVDTTGEFCETSIRNPADSLALDGQNDPQAQGQDNNNDNGGNGFVLPVVYVVLGVAFLAVVIASVSGLVYKKIYVPLKSRRGEKAVVPFDNNLMGESKHYNPMYFGPDTITPEYEMNIIEESSVENTPSPSLKGVDSVGFANPMYAIENHYDTPTKQTDNDDYEYIEQRRDTNASDGIYEELPDVDPFENVYMNQDSTKVQKSIYDTLGNDAMMPEFDDGSNENIYENSTPSISIYNTLQHNNELDCSVSDGDYNTLQKNQH